MQKTVYKKVVQFDKVDYRGSGRKSYTPEIEFGLELHEWPDKRTIDLELAGPYLEFTASGGIWNPRMTDYVTCGQNLEEILNLVPENGDLRRLVTIWRRWHLNGLHAGTTRQMEIIELMSPLYPWLFKNGLYDGRLAVLELSNLLFDNDYCYGSAWLVELLPNEVVDQILSLFPEIRPRVYLPKEIEDVRLS